MKKILSDVMALLFFASALGAYADNLLERGLNVAEELEGDVMRCPIDLRAMFPVKVVNDPALHGITYSSRGWRIDVEEDDPSRKAEIMAAPGTFEDGKFSPDGAAVTVLPATTGEGTMVWTPSDFSKMVYQLTHVAKINGTRDESSVCHAYLDFTKCAANASQAEVEAAVLGDISHPIVTVQDRDLPWQPIVSDTERAGIATDASLVSETTTTAFSIKGRGTFHYEYRMSGGTLVVRVDGEQFGRMVDPVDWRTCTIAIQGCGAHEVSFAYTAAIGGGWAALRNVRWKEEDGWMQAQGEVKKRRVDLREGVRRPKYRDEILPFVYSSTNWIGVAGATAESAARVTIVPMAGTDSDVTQWTESGVPIELHDAPGEADVKWRKPEKGVWKATFDIMNGDKSIYSEERFFDLRKTRKPGMAVYVF